MVRLFAVIILIYITILCISCNRQELDDIIEYPNLILEGEFENPLVLDDQFTSNGNGSITLDALNAYDGNYSALFTSTGCFEVQNMSVFSFEKNSTYELSFAIKMAGNSTGCASLFQMTLNSPELQLLNFNLDSSNAINWTVKKYYFTPAEDLTANLSFIIGIDTLLLDNLQIVKMY